MGLIVLVDMDGPACDFETHFLKSWRVRYPGEAFIPIAQRKNFWVQEQYGKLDRRYPAMIDDLVGNEAFFRTMPPVPGVRRAVREMTEAGVQVYICSSPRPSHPVTAIGKLEWIREHFGEFFLMRTILTQDKTLVHGDLLIDDKPDISGARSCPSWRQILWDAPLNRSATGMPRMRRWTSWRTFVCNGNGRSNNH